MILDFDEIYLSSTQILERISEKSIYDYYLNSNTQTGSLVKCCFHEDSSPSLGFYTGKSDRLMFKCFGCGQQGNVFDFVSKLHNCNFSKSLNIIQHTFKLSKNDTCHKIGKYEITNNIVSKNNTVIPKFKTWSITDLIHWRQFNISFDTLDKFNVKPCTKVYIQLKSGDYVVHSEYKKDNPIYCYSISDKYKIYRPYADKKGKWYANTSNYDIQGMEQLPEKGELLIITSSLKDVMVLYEMGYNAIALGGEGNYIPDSILDYLWACFDNIIIFFDNDKAGLKYASSLSDKINIPYIHIPIEYEEKDISDFVKVHSYEKAKLLMKQLI